MGKAKSLWLAQTPASGVAHLPAALILPGSPYNMQMRLLSDFVKRFTVILLVPAQPLPSVILEPSDMWT